MQEWNDKLAFTAFTVDLAQYPELVVRLREHNMVSNSQPVCPPVGGGNNACTALHSHAPWGQGIGYAFMSWGRFVSPVVASYTKQEYLDLCFVCGHGNSWLSVGPTCGELTAAWSGGGTLLD